MAYLNPFYYLSIDPADLAKSPEKVLKKKRKEFLAEFDLADGSTLELQGKEMDKDTVLRLLEALVVVKDKGFHQKVFEDDDLRRFLESGDLQLFEGELTCFSDRKLMGFVQDAFTAKYNESLFKAVKEESLEEIQLLVKKRLPFRPKGIAACYKDAYRYLIYMLDEANGLERKKNVANRFTTVLMLLPPYFDTVRKRYKPYLDTPDLFDPETAKKLRKYLVAGLVGIGVLLLWWLV